jgi:hypothetical protein
MADDIGIRTGWRFSKGEAPPTNFFRQFNLRFLPTIVKGGFYQKLAAYGHFGRPVPDRRPADAVMIPALSPT